MVYVILYGIKFIKENVKFLLIRVILYHHKWNDIYWKRISYVFHMEENRTKRVQTVRVISVVIT